MSFRRPSECFRIFYRTALFGFFALTGACSLPNLEPPSCVEARIVIREFYSIHFGNEMRFSPEGLKLRERFLAPDFVKKVSAANEGVDPFTTGTDDIPKAFRVGECRQSSAEQVQFDVLLFWRDDTRTEQKQIRVDMADRNDSWLISDISR